MKGFHKSQDWFSVEYIFILRQCSREIIFLWSISETKYILIILNESMKKGEAVAGSLIWCLINSFSDKWFRWMWPYVRFSVASHAELSFFVACDLETLISVRFTCFIVSHCPPYSGKSPDKALKDPRYRVLRHEHECLLLPSVRRFSVCCRSLCVCSL